jgi:hypothetical protein
VHFFQKHSYFFFCFILFCEIGFSQSFPSLQQAEKCWVIKHPFAALSAKRIARITLAKVDSLKKANVLDTFLSGGKLDAFRHIYWMYLLSQKIGANKARSLGKAHEKGNYQQFLKLQFEDQSRPDSLSCEMDLKNNEIGIGLACSKVVSNQFTMDSILNYIQNNKAWLLKRKDAQLVNCNEAAVNIRYYQTKWFVPYCLIMPSKD